MAGHFTPLTDRTAGGWSLTFWHFRKTLFGLLLVLWLFALSSDRLLLFEWICWFVLFSSSISFHLVFYWVQFEGRCPITLGAMKMKALKWSEHLQLHMFICCIKSGCRLFIEWLVWTPQSLLCLVIWELCPHLMHHSMSIISLLMLCLCHSLAISELMTSHSDFTNLLTFSQD